MSFCPYQKNKKNPKAIPALHRNQTLIFKNITDVNKNLTRIIYPNNIHTHFDKKAFCRHSLLGSMTVEAAVVVPLLLFAWIAFISLISVARAHERIQQSLTDSALALAIEAGRNEESVQSSWMVKVWAGLSALEDMETGGVQSVSGYNFSGSQVLAGDSWICLEATYQIKPMEGLIPLPGIRLKSRACTRAWTGYVPGEEERYGESGHSYVYVAENGQVYHEDRMCSQIKLSIHITDREHALTYPPCERCVGNDIWQGETFYLTETGECYHSRLGCSGLKRTIKRVESDEASISGLVPCQRCTGK